MSSNRYVAIHCLQKKYIDDIKKNGISRETKAVFICDLENIDEECLLNTIAVSIYHGIGIENWNNFIKCTDKNIFKYMNDELLIAFALFSRNQEHIIENSNIKNYYKIYNKTRTLDYSKIKDIGVIKNVKIIEELLPSNTNINAKMNINPIKNRFFIKNVYNDNFFEYNETVDEISNVCYDAAKINISTFKNNLEIMRNKLMKEE